MSKNDKLLGARLKLEWTKKHIIDLEMQCRVFRDSKPYGIGVKKDPQSGNTIHYVAHLDEIPAAIGLIATDALANLRSALDHTAWQIWLDGDMAGNKTSVQFPIADSATAYRSKLARVIKGARQEVIEVINAIQPYRGGNGHPLWIIDDLNNIAKHRLLLTVSAAIKNVNIGMVFNPTLLNNPKADVRLTSRTGLWQCPLKSGDELSVEALNPELNEQMFFAYEISLGEPQIAAGDSILKTITDLFNFVSDVVNQIGRVL